LNLCREGVGADAQAGRFGDHGEARQPKGDAVRQIIRLAGAKLFFLPKYSPDLNPIKQVFVKFKHLLRKAAARTLETVLAAIGELLDAYTPKSAPTISKTPNTDKPENIPL